MNRYHDHSNPYKGKHLIGASLQVQNLVYYHHGRKHGGMQADMVLEKEPVILHLDQQAAGGETQRTWLEHLKP